MEKVIIMTAPFMSVARDYGYVDFYHLPMGPSMIASSLDKNLYDVDFYHYDASGVLPDLSEYDYVLFSAEYKSKPTDKQGQIISRDCHNRLNEILSKIDKKTVVGGQLVSWGWGKEINADVVVSGYVDKNINRYIKSSGFIESRSRQLTGQPIDYNIMNPEDFRYSYDTIYKKLGKEIIPVDGSISLAYTQYSTGCDNKCEYCAVRNRTEQLLDIDSVKHIITSLIDNGFNGIGFLNSYINRRPKLAEKICNWIVKENIQFTWSDSVRLSMNDPDFYKMLYDAGCRCLYSGMESLSNKMMKSINKGLTLDKMLRNLEMIDDAGIFNAVNIIVGLPNEYHNDLQESLDLIVENKSLIDAIEVNRFIMERNSGYHINQKKHGLMVMCIDGTEMMYIEKRSNLSYQDIIDKKQRYWSHTMKTLEDNGIMTERVNMHLLFTLYNQFGNKERVNEKI